LYVLIKIRVATIDTNQSVTDSTQSNAASIQKLPDSVVKSVSSPWTVDVSDETCGLSIRLSNVHKR